MGKTTRSHTSLERQKRDKILVKMLKSQQEQIETLVKEREILEDHLKMQHEKWVSDVRLYEDHISQVSPEFCWFLKRGFWIFFVIIYVFILFIFYF